MKLNYLLNDLNLERKLLSAVNRMGYMQKVYSPKIIKGGLILYMRITLCHHAYCKGGYIPVNEIYLSIGHAHI